MRRFVMVGIIAVSAAEVSAAGLGLKPGLWEAKIIKQVVDGRDAAPQMNDAMAKMQQAMANMPPDQRARIEEMMKQRGAPAVMGNGTVKMCIGSEEAPGKKPAADGEQHCAPADVSHNGNRTTYVFSCTRNGTTTSGKGEFTTTGNAVTNQVDVTTKKPDGTSHVMHNETEMTYLGADCGTLKPAPIFTGVQ